MAFLDNCPFNCSQNDNALSRPLANHVSFSWNFYKRAFIKRAQHNTTLSRPLKKQPFFITVLHTSPLWWTYQYDLMSRHVIWGFFPKEPYKNRSFFNRDLFVRLTNPYQYETTRRFEHPTSWCLVMWYGAIFQTSPTKIGLFSKETYSIDWQTRDYTALSSALQPRFVKSCHMGLFSESALHFFFF